MLKKNKDLKLYYSVSEVAQMLGVSESLLRFWEKEFPQIAPKKAGRGIRQYRKEDIDTLKLIYHLVKEQGMTLQGARQRLEVNNKSQTTSNFELLGRGRAVRGGGVGGGGALSAVNWGQVEALKGQLAE